MSSVSPSSKLLNPKGGLGDPQTSEIGARSEGRLGDHSLTLHKVNSTGTENSAGGAKKAA